MVVPRLRCPAKGQDRKGRKQGRDSGLREVDAGIPVAGNGQKGGGLTLSQGPWWPEGRWGQMTESPDSQGQVLGR